MTANLQTNVLPPDAPPGSVQRIVLQRLLRKWRRKAKEFGKQVRPEWEHGDKYASRRYEGESIALRWCAEDLEAALENMPTELRDAIFDALARGADSPEKPEPEPTKTIGPGPHVTVEVRFEVIETHTILRKVDAKAFKEELKQGSVCNFLEECIGPDWPDSEINTDHIAVKEWRLVKEQAGRGLA